LATTAYQVNFNTENTKSLFTSRYISINDVIIILILKTQNLKTFTLYKYMGLDLGHRTH